MKHLLKISQDSQALYKEYDVTYYNHIDNKVFVKKHYETPFIKILTNSLYYDTSIIPLKAKKYGNISNDIQWSFQLLNEAEENTANIDNNILIFSKHYEGEVKLTATAGNITSEKTITIDCIELPLSVEYQVIQPETVIVEWDTTEALIAYTGQVVETFKLKPQRITKIEELTQTVTFDKNPHVEPSYATNTIYIDFNLPSELKWAKCPIGAMNEYENGLYFQWGDTEGYVNASNEPSKQHTGSFKWNGIDVNWTVEQKGYAKVFDWEHYKYCDGTYDTINKYNNVDGKTTLENDDDPVRVHIGGTGKRMPSVDDYEELLNNTVHIWSPANKVVMVKTKDEEGNDTIIEVKYPEGYFIYAPKDERDKSRTFGKNQGQPFGNYSPDAHYESESSQTIIEGDKHLFLPFNGYCVDDRIDSEESEGNYLTNSLYNGESSFNLGYNNVILRRDKSMYRCYGTNIRAVMIEFW